MIFTKNKVRLAILTDLKQEKFSLTKVKLIVAVVFRIYFSFFNVLRADMWIFTS